MARTLDAAPDYICCDVCGREISMQKHHKYRYRNGQRKFYCKSGCFYVANTGRKRPDVTKRMNGNKYKVGIAPPNKECAETRFHRKYEIVTESGCWLWTGALNKCGYGVFRSDSNIYAHRYSYELYNGQIPTTGAPHDTCILHVCDVPSCVNPGHLFLGSQNDNVKDCINKGRRWRNGPI